MDIWHYHPEDGRLLGQSVADPDPMVPGNWLIPAWATTIAPPTVGEKQATAFNGSAWRVVPDRRGETWWRIGAVDNTQPVIVDFIGAPASRGLTNVEPPALPDVVAPIVVNAWQIRQALNALNLRGDIEAYIASADQTLKDAWEYAPQFERTHPLIMAVGSALAKTDAQIDELFELAKTL